MREIELCGNKVRIKATPLTLLFYRQEFDSDMIGDLMRMREISTNPAAYDGLRLLQMIWALMKTDKPKEFPAFETWLDGLDCFDFTDQIILEAVTEEASDGFFRGAHRQG